MNVNPITNVGVAVGLFLSTALSLPSYAQSSSSDKFFCGKTAEGVPATIVKHPKRGNVVLIRWSSEYFGSSWSTDKRCQEVSRRFQEAYKERVLSYIIPGQQKGYPVVCASSTKNGSCQKMLFTLKKGADPSTVIKELNDVNRDANADPLDQNPGLLQNSKGEWILHVDTFIGVAEENSSSSDPSSNNP